jgi:hypothetical protein
MRIGRWDITFAFSLFCSLLINSGMVGVVVLRAQPPKVVDLADWRTRLLRQPTTEPAEPPPDKFEFDNRDVFGEHQGTGEALNSSPGDQPLQAMKGPQLQAYLGRNRPSAQGGGGTPTLIGAASPAQAAAPHVTPPAPRVTPPAPRPKPAQRPPDVVVDAAGNQPQTPPPTPQVNASPLTNVSPQTPPSPQANKSSQTPVSPPAVAAAVEQQGKPLPPGPPAAAADTAPPSDKDSDPFSDNNSFRYVNGSVSARNGRQVKTVRPHLLQAGEFDASVMRNPSVTFLATVDEHGNVIHVDLYRTSGSDNIDQPCEEALQQWWIEPSKDENGRPTRDIVSVTFSFYGD